MRTLGFRRLCLLGSGFLLTLLCGLQAGFGQTSADLSTRYRQVISYLLRPTVIMTPRFAADGQVCEMAIERRQNTDTEIVIATSFSEEEVHELVDELAPEAERGRNLTRHLNGFCGRRLGHHSVHLRKSSRTGLWNHSTCTYWR